MALSTSLTQVTRVGLSSYQDYQIHAVTAVGVATFSNFKTGSTNVHNVGIEAAGINVLGADTPIGTGSTIYDDGGARFSGIVTASGFSGDGSALIGVASTDNIKPSTTANFTGGIQVGGAATFTGDVGIGGTLTYEDVTNIDSVGLVTARKGVRITEGGLIVTAGVTTVGSAITMGGGTVTATTFVGSGSGLTGVASTDYIITGTAATFNNQVNVLIVNVTGVSTGTPL